MTNVINFEISKKLNEKNILKDFEVKYFYFKEKENDNFEIKDENQIQIILEKQHLEKGDFVNIKLKTLTFEEAVTFILKKDFILQFEQFNTGNIFTNDTSCSNKLIDSLGLYIELLLDNGTLK